MKLYQYRNHQKQQGEEFIILRPIYVFFLLSKVFQLYKYAFRNLMILAQCISFMIG